MIPKWLGCLIYRNAVSQTNESDLTVLQFSERRKLLVAGGLFASQLYFDVIGA